ncbi:MAG: DivIVA domain-containing protein [Firmicutes bacterium]|jgi:cell division initiation protein|nr:DivIVA domain-containing protein [Bacillota bacterium]
MLSPLDIHNKEFRRSFRGYSEAEVDEFLDQVVRDFETLLKENSEMKARIEDLEEKVAHFKVLEETLNNTLVVAQRTAEDVKASAHREAEVMIREAGAEANRIVEEGRAKARLVEEQYHALKHEMETFRARMKALLQSYLEMLDRGLHEAEEDAEA